jgi:hypothetical protein
MDTVFHNNSYREILRQAIRAMPGSGRGYVGKLAEQLRVQGSFVSQVLSGSRNFSEDQLFKAGRFLGLDDRALEFSLKLLRLENATDEGLRSHLQKAITEAREAAAFEGSNPSAGGLSERDRSIYYSHWHFSAIHVLTSIRGYQGAEPISRKLGLPLEKAASALDFLVRCGLCTEKNGKVVMSATKSFLKSDGPLITRHHSNWRIKAVDQIPKSGTESLHFTCPVSISAADARKLRESLESVIREFYQVVDPSACEALYCLNLDWFAL